HHLSERMRLRSVALLLLFASAGAASQPDTFRFAVLGDRTGETQPGVFEETLREAAAEGPAFIISTGDLIEGSNDATAEAEWQILDQILLPFRRYPFYAAPGNHDVWSGKSANLFKRHTGRPLQYGFDYQRAHFAVLDNSRTEQFAPDEMTFLERDLQTHA